MADKLKEAIPNTIDNEKEGIENSLDTLEDKVALGMLINIDKQVPKYDIDLAKDGNSYRFIVDNEVALDIPLKGNEIKEVGTFLVTLLNNIDRITESYINENDVILEIDKKWNPFDELVLGTNEIRKLFGLKVNLNSNGSLYSKRNKNKEQIFQANEKIRELFRFIQTIRNK